MKLISAATACSSVKVLPDVDLYSVCEKCINDFSGKEVSRIKLFVIIVYKVKSRNHRTTSACFCVVSSSDGIYQVYLIQITLCMIVLYK